jgi:hypothetical protein
MMPKIGHGGQVMLCLKKGIVKKGQIEAMKSKYFHDTTIVRAGGENTVPLLEVDEVAVFKCFMKVVL